MRLPAAGMISRGIFSGHEGRREKDHEHEKNIRGPRAR
jgi:hypothetical protein